MKARLIATSSKTAKTAIAMALSAVLATAGVAAAAHSSPPTAQDYKRVGSEPRNLDQLKAQINAYYNGYTDSSGHHHIGPHSQWAADVATEIGKARAYLVQRLAHNAPRIPAIMLDIDDTSISTYPVNADFDFSGGPDARAADAQADADNTYPVIKPTLDLAKWAHAHGVKGRFHHWSARRPHRRHPQSADRTGLPHRRPLPASEEQPALLPALRHHLHGGPVQVQHAQVPGAEAGLRLHRSYRRPGQRLRRRLRRPRLQAAQPHVQHPLTPRPMSQA
ncbi:hypothetical protein [Streptomyces griseofuscus]